MESKDFDRCLHNLIVTAANGHKITNSQLIGSLEIAKQNVFMMMQAAKAKKELDILHVPAPLPPGLGS